MDPVVEQALTEARSLLADLVSDYPTDAAMTHACCEAVTARIDAALTAVRNTS